MLSKDTKILECNQYQKSFKTPSIICENLKYFINKTDVKRILKKYPQKKWVNIFFVRIQCLRYGNLMVRKISMMYAEVKIAWTNFENP